MYVRMYQRVARPTKNTAHVWRRKISWDDDIESKQQPATTMESDRAIPAFLHPHLDICVLLFQRSAISQRELSPLIRGHARFYIFRDKMEIFNEI